MLLLLFILFMFKLNIRFTEFLNFKVIYKETLKLLKKIKIFYFVLFCFQFFVIWKKRGLKIYFMHIFQ